MRQAIGAQHQEDERGNPAGGRTIATGIEINWQNGPLGRGPERQPANGAFVEGVIAAALDRLYYYQGSAFKCRENAIAITKLEEALHWLDHRTQDREARAVEGTHAV
jgi:hypothetical protein